jgi:DNA-binding winged helix-turn-helix (wHTH) protein
MSDQPIRRLRRFHVAGGKDIAMRTHNSSCEALDRMQAAFADTDPRTTERRSTISSNSATTPEQDRSFAPGEQMPPTLRNELAKLLTDIGQSLASSKLGKMVDRMRGSSTPRNEPLAMVQLESSGESLARLLTPLNETLLRVGRLELDLIDRTAKRGDRHIDLRPREFKLLKYMMQRSDEVLSRATLLKEVWHYKSLPQTNLVDVHVGRLRRKIDGANEAPMIRNVRGVGFVLDAVPLSQGSAKKHDDEIAASRVPVSSCLPLGRNYFADLSSTGMINIRRRA